MTTYTDEQLTYINFEEKTHTKLLACAGSGKTRCIIARISHLIKQGIYKPDEIMMLTFSRFTRDDFMNKVRLYTSTDTPCITHTSIKTIDSFAKHIIDKNSLSDTNTNTQTNAIDVSLLSYKLMLFLENSNESVLKQIDMLNRIKIVFIDEAQDLNEIQYRIFCQMRKLGIIINMIGDPNQNIYQFRKSSDKYLTLFDGKVFKLTTNFRSHKSIVEFSKHLRPFTEYDVVCSKGDNNCQPLMMFYENESVLEENILCILTEAVNQGIDLSEFAILAPTRGRMRGGGRSHGLCFVSNVLYKAGFKFKQFYEETSEDNSNAGGEGVKYEPVKDHINVLTYMGSKGLEWSYVILVDADVCLINKRYFDKDKHKNDRYLLYVACSRAIHNMYIFSQCYFNSGRPYFKTNPWFEKIPTDLYKLDERFEHYFEWPELKYVDLNEKETYLSRIVHKLSCYDLDKIADLISYASTTPSIKTIYSNNYAEIDKVSGIFLSRYIDNLFRSLIGIASHDKENTMRFSEIESIIESDTIVSGAPDEIIVWYYKNRTGMSWETFDQLDPKAISQDIKTFIKQKFDRTKKFDSHTIALNGYYEMYILEQKKWIADLYNKYRRCQNTAQLRDIVFYLTVVMHAVHTHHYFHIKSKGRAFKSILTDFKPLFQDLEAYAASSVSTHGFVSSHTVLCRYGLTSNIDTVSSDGKIWITKCTADISLKNIIHGIALNVMNRSHSGSDDDGDDIRCIGDMSITTNFINLLKGEELVYTFDLKDDTIRSIIDILIENMGRNADAASSEIEYKPILDIGANVKTNMDITIVADEHTAIVDPVEIVEHTEPVKLVQTKTRRAMKSVEQPKPAEIAETKTKRYRSTKPAKSTRSARQAKTKPQI